MNTQKTILAGSLFGAIGVILGALGAHFLKERLGAEQLSSFETGVKFQMYHAIVLLIMALLLDKFNYKGLNTSILLIIAGTICFSFSIYILSTRSLFGMSGQLKFLGPVTPIGGLLLIAGWFNLFVTFLKTKA